jgi:hypothetical protein
LGYVMGSVEKYREFSWEVESTLHICWVQSAPILCIDRWVLQGRGRVQTHAFCLLPHKKVGNPSCGEFIAGVS